MWPVANLVNKMCLWTWGSPRLIRGVPGTKGVQNGVGSRLKGRNTSKKTKEKGGEMKKRRKEKGGKRKL